MFFSVLMSLYEKERPEFLRLSLESVFGQTIVASEVVLVLDGPITTALQSVVNEYASKHSELKIIPLTNNVGLGSALNEGLKHCTCDLVIRMDTDDVCFPDRFEKQVKYMEEHPDIVASSGWIEEFEEEIENPVSIKKVPETSDEIRHYGLTRNPLNHPAVIFRKKIIESVGSYQHFPLFEDWYLWARLMAQNYKLGNIQAPLVHFRTSSDMYKRRGGFKYAADSFRFQLTLHKLGLISYSQAIKSGMMRGIVYVMPNAIRRFIYKNLLRN